MIIDDQAIISVQRSADAITWLRELIATNVSSAEAKRQTTNLQPSPTTIQTIEAVRKIFEHLQTKASDQQHASEQQFRHLQLLQKTWQRAGADVVRSLLDPAALTETDRLADICAALNLLPHHALSPTHQVTSISRLAQNYLSLDSRLTEREFTLSKAHQMLREAVEELRNATYALDSVTQNLDHCENENENLINNEASVRQMTTKYYEEANAIEKEMANAGIAPDLTHEQIYGDGKQLQKLESQLEEIKLDLEKYYGLPAVSDFFF